MAVIKKIALLSTYVISKIVRNENKKSSIEIVDWTLEKSSADI